jgi:hypothetical protein
VDVASIQRIGDSLKKAESKGGKTGRFGVGFNSVYHLTDLPAFASGSRLVMFDPHATHLPHVNPANPGKLLDLAAGGPGAELVRRHPPLFEPFRAFGFDPAACPPPPDDDDDARRAGGSGSGGGTGGGGFAGTLFRLPLRTAAQARTSKLSSRAHAPAGVTALLDELAAEAAPMLLFLKHVERIAVYEWDDTGAGAPRLCREACLVVGGQQNGGSGGSGAAQGSVIPLTADFPLLPPLVFSFPSDGGLPAQHPLRGLRPGHRRGAGRHAGGVVRGEPASWAAGAARRSRATRRTSTCGWCRGRGWRRACTQRRRATRPPRRCRRSLAARWAVAAAAAAVRARWRVARWRRTQQQQQQQQQLQQRAAPTGGGIGGKKGKKGKKKNDSSGDSAAPAVA